MNSGYSKTPLEQKLGLRDGYHCNLINAPKHYVNWFVQLDLNLNLIEDAQTESIDFIHLFVTSEDDLETHYANCKWQLKKEGMLWISWPKGSSAISTDLKREPIRDFVLTRGLVDVKVAAIDEDWSGLKFVYRLKDRA